MLALDPKFENGWYNLAAMYADVKRYGDALASLDMLSSLNPNAQDAKSMRREIEDEVKHAGAKGK